MKIATLAEAKQLAETVKQASEKSIERLAAKGHDTLTAEVYLALLGFILDLPDAPEPDWSDAPERATHHVFAGDGMGIWLESPNMEPYPVHYGWSCPGNAWNSGLELPAELMYWHTTLRRRKDLT